MFYLCGINSTQIKLESDNIGELIAKLLSMYLFLDVLPFYRWINASIYFYCGAFIGI